MPCSSTVAPSSPFTVTDVAGAERARAVVGDDLAALHQPVRPLQRVVDDLLLAGLADREVDDRLAGFDAELLGAGDVAERRGRLEELLGRDAPAVQAGAADLVLLDHGDREARRSRRRARLRSRPDRRR